MQVNSIIIFLITYHLQYSIRSLTDYWWFIPVVCVRYYSDICSENPSYYYIVNKNDIYYTLSDLHDSFLLISSCANDIEKLNFILRYWYLSWSGWSQWSRFFLFIEIYIWIFNITIKRNDLSWSSIKMISRLVLGLFTSSNVVFWNF